MTNRGVDALGRLRAESDTLGVLLLLVSIRVVLRDVNCLAVSDALELERVLGGQVVLLGGELDAATVPLDQERALPKRDTYMNISLLYHYHTAHGAQPSLTTAYSPMAARASAQGPGATLPRCAEQMRNNSL